MATPTEMAHEAQRQIAELRSVCDTRFSGIDKLELVELRERLAVVEEKIAKAERELESLKTLPVLDDRVDKLERHKDDSEKRRWQFVYIFAGAISTLLVTVIIQLVLLPLVKK